MRRASPEALELGARATAPTYVYDLQRLSLRCELLKRLPVTRKKLFFATMANDHPSILACIRDCGLGVFVNSVPHLRLVRELGFEPSRIIFAASNMGEEELLLCVRERVHMVLDSVSQVRALASCAPKGLEIGVRLNVGSALDRAALRHDPSYRFGLLRTELPEAIRLARAAGVRVVGVHSYFGTGLMDHTILLDGMEELCQVAESVPDLRYIDVGGGFGVPDTLDGTDFDLETYGKATAEIIARHEARIGRELYLYLEPGRYLAAECGYFFVTVVDCKVREDRIFVGTNGSVALFPRPLLYPEQARHPCEVVQGRAGAPPHPLPIFVCGNSTYSQDFLARNISLQLPAVGDALVFYNAGAYGRSMLTRFLGKEAPVEVVLPTGRPGSATLTVAEALGVS